MVRLKGSVPEAAVIPRVVLVLLLALAAVTAYCARQGGDTPPAPGEPAATEDGPGLHENPDNETDNVTAVLHNEDSLQLCGDLCCAPPARYDQLLLQYLVESFPGSPDVDPPDDDPPPPEVLAAVVDVDAAVVGEADVVWELEEPQAAMVSAATPRAGSMARRRIRGEVWCRIDIQTPYPPRRLARTGDFTGPSHRRQRDARTSQVR